MTHGSLFSGIGGFDLAAEWIGWQNSFNCEIDAFCRKILKYHFPKAIQYDDIKQTDFTIWRGHINVLSGGFPCQPFSVAGERRGTEDNRYLWTEMLRAIREIAPDWIVGENVRGLVSWNRGMVFDTVCADMEAAGYEVMPVLLPACGVNAPHRRERIWFIAHRADAGFETMQCRGEDRIYAFDNAPDTVGSRFLRRGRKSDQWSADTSIWSRIHSDPKRSGCEQFVANPASKQSNEHQLMQSEVVCKKQKQFRREYSADCFTTIPHWNEFPTQSPICSRNDGVSYRLDGITFPKWREQSIKAYGNAVVPQVVFEIFKIIDKWQE